MRLARAILIAGLLLVVAAAPSAARPAGDVGARIINGSVAPAGAWPSIAHMRGFVTPTSYLQCGGTLIAPSVIVTAAHCMTSSTGQTVNAAWSYSRIGVTNTADASTEVDWASYEIHPDYGSPGVYDNDVALVTLVAPSAAVPMPVIAPWQDGLVVGGASAAIAGWGRTASGLTSQFLLEATVPITSDAECARIWGGLFSAASMVCAGDLASGIDTCQGDSGGPLALTIAGTRTLVGDTSWGTQTCASGLPGVYGRMSAFRSWILDGGTSASTLVRTFVAAQTATAQNLALTSTGPDVTLTWGVTPANWTTTGFRVTINGSAETVPGPTAARTLAIPGGGTVTALVEPQVTLGAAAAATISATPTPTRAPVVTARVDAAPRVDVLLNATGASDDPWGQAPVYEWRVGGALVQQGAQTTFSPTAAQAGKLVTLTVLATNAAGTGSATVEAGRVSQGPQVARGPIRVTGAARVGGRLRARPPVVSGYPAPKPTYRWFRDGRRVRSATGAIYRVRPVDAGARITGRVTWTNAVGTVTRALRPVTIAD